MAQRLFVGNLPFTATESELHELFSTVGQCTSVSLNVDRMTGRPRGFGFVEMGSDAAAQQAVTQLDGRDFQGRRLNVSEARERSAGGPPRSGGYDAGPPGRSRFPKDGGSRRGLRARRRSL
jgi:RNA recognition motif-containing protein